MNSDVVITVMDKFAERVHGTNVVVVDNAPLHRSKAFRSHLVDWAANRVHLDFLPPYSPELNLIKLVWKQMKHHWLPLSSMFTTAFVRTSAAISS